MSIEVISKIKQKNNGTFKLMDLADVDYDGSGKSAKEEIEKAGYGLEVDSTANKLYLKDKVGSRIGDGVTISTSSAPSENHVFTVYDDETGEETTMTGTLGEFTYEELDI